MKSLNQTYCSRYTLDDFVYFYDLMQKTFVITGGQGSGKTTLIKETVILLKEDRFKIGGILAGGSWKNNRRERFELTDIKTGDRMVYLQREPANGWEKIRHFYINPAGQKFGEHALSIDQVKDVDLVVIDEIGPFELQGRGWAIAMKNIMDNLHIPLLITVRESLVNEVIGYFGLEVPVIFNATKITPAMVLVEIEKYLSRRSFPIT